MRQYISSIIGTLAVLMAVNAHANPQQSNRTPLLVNDEVKVWKTVIYPSKEQILTMHRHEHNRVVIALDSGKLKITDNKGKVHYLELQKDQAYFLTKDIPGELHTDENMSQHPINVVVIELNK